jgi:hypothetical protein
MGEPGQGSFQIEGYGFINVAPSDSTNSVSLVNYVFLDKYFHLVTYVRAGRPINALISLHILLKKQLGSPYKQQHNLGSP